MKTRCFLITMVIIFFLCSCGSSTSCKDVNKIKSENREDVEANFEELTNQGYSPCGHCKPR